MGGVTFKLNEFSERLIVEFEPEFLLHLRREAIPNDRFFVAVNNHPALVQHYLGNLPPLYHASISTRVANHKRTEESILAEIFELFCNLKTMSIYQVAIQIAPSTSTQECEEIYRIINQLRHEGSVTNIGIACESKSDQVAQELMQAYRFDCLIKTQESSIYKRIKNQTELDAIINNV